jgi:hypothetical protein
MKNPVNTASDSAIATLVYLCALFAFVWAVSHVVRAMRLIL